MSTKMGWTTVCGDCGRHGPEADTSPEARQVALDAGWSIGIKESKNGTSIRGEDYCPLCRFIHDRVQCNHKSGGNQCISDSRYRLSRAENLYTPEEVSHALIGLGIDPVQVLERMNKRIKDSSEWWSCGKHLPVFTRDMLNATPEPVLLVRV